MLKYKVLLAYLDEGVLRMTSGDAIELTEVLEIIHGDLVSSQVEHAVWPMDGKDQDIIY